MDVKRLTLETYGIFFLIFALALPFVALSQSSEASSTPEEVVDNSWFKTQSVQLNGRTFNDFVVSPGKIELVIPAGESRTVEISVANRLDDNRVFNIEIEDFTAAADSNDGVKLLGDEHSPYTLKDYIQIPDDNFRIRLGSRALIPVTVSIPADAEPGGRYGSVLISTVKLGSTSDGTGASSPIIARLGTLFFITVPGDINYQAELKDFSTINGKKWYESGPIEFGIVHENTGTTHINPYGELEISNMFDEVVGFVELEPWFVMPRSVRLREVTWDRETLFGRYTATLRVNRGYDDIIDEKTITFWVLPWKVIVGIFVIVFVIVFIIRFFAKNFEFKRKP